ncbi:hypothetical protein PoB_002868000 [Plakobranchus ocellatus]|uniref:Uncharacterized protein n=1 Tax=Plakobranchus ocellatus TaxID=259542 RepID=A0AAV4A5R7_9GAST|nr:hypothetical protein PoB_002868000 [Plakobranchus ocellatus]
MREIFALKRREFSILWATYIRNVVLIGNLGGPTDNKPVLRSLGTLLSRVPAPSSTPWSDAKPESLRSPTDKL